MIRVKKLYSIRVWRFEASFIQLIILKSYFVAFAVLCPLCILLSINRFPFVRKSIPWYLISCDQSLLEAIMFNVVEMRRMLSARGMKKHVKRKKPLIKVIQFRANYYRILSNKTINIVYHFQTICGWEFHPSKCQMQSRINITYIRLYCIIE